MCGALRWSLTCSEELQVFLFLNKRIPLWSNRIGPRDVSTRTAIFCQSGSHGLAKDSVTGTMSDILLDKHIEASVSAQFLESMLTLF